VKVIRIISALLVAALVLTIVLRSLRRDTRIDAFVDIRIGDAALDREVAEAELAEYGAELVPALRAELHNGAWRQGRLWLWVAPHLPQVVRNHIGRGD
jgi:hypothetical protein